MTLIFCKFSDTMAERPQRHGNSEVATHIKIPVQSHVILASAYQVMVLLSRMTVNSSLPPVVHETC